MPVTLPDFMVARLNARLDTLKAWLTTNPGVYLLEAAAHLTRLYPRELLPDWIEILANGDTSHWSAVIETALEDIQAEEKAHAS